MRNWSIDVSLDVAMLLSMSAALLLAQDGYLAVESQRHLQAAADACSDDLAVAIQQANTYQAPHPVVDLRTQPLEINIEATQLLHARSALIDELRQVDRLQPTGLRAAALQELRAEIDDNQTSMDAALQRSSAAIAALRTPKVVDLAEGARLKADVSRLQGQLAKLRVTVAAGVSAPSNALPWAALMAGVLPPMWIARMLWFRRRRTLRQRDDCCITCGYDLRASTGRCPECATVRATVTSPAGV